MTSSHSVTADRHDVITFRRLIWPEAEVLYYNTVLNKSKDWGVSPFGWYFYSAIPRAMSATLVLVPVGAAMDSRVRASLFL